jgi:hypothetical protein
MDAGPDVQRSDFGPISPELALVDSVLAEQARKLLPDPPDSLAPRVPVASVVTASAAAERRAVPLPPLAPRPRRRWPQTVAVAVIVFAAGAAAGTLLRGEDAAPSGVALQVRTVPPATATATATAASGEGRARQPSSSRKAARRASARPVQRPQTRSWAANVLGVAAQVAGPRVKLVWHPPASSTHVVVLRALGDRRRATVVFRGRATSFRDVSPRPCTVYRYTIVNYDRSGHRSTGVPTSVVTGGCT